MPENKFPSIPGYLIKEIIGKGGMGIVYLAIQTSLDREVALKVTLPSLAEMDESFTKRFVREAKATAALNHPNIITIYDAGVHENSSYMAMEYISTGTLADLEHRSLSQDEICDLFISIGLGLNAAHKAGFVHRDIKPDNILIDANGNPQVTDFGIVKSLGSQNTALTLSGGTIGTPQYMSPEQIKAEDLDGRSDLYSVGVMLFNLLEGHVPFYDETPSAVYIKHVTTAAPPLSDKNKAFQPIIKTLLRKDPKNRFEGAEKLVKALRKLKKDRFATVKKDNSVGRVATKVNFQDIPSAKKQIKRKVVTGAPTVVSIESLGSSNNKYKIIGALVLLAVFTTGFFVYNKFSTIDEELQEQEKILANDRRNQEHQDYWNKIKQTNSIAGYQDYIDTYPQGSYQSQALKLQNQIKQLEKEKLVEQIKTTDEVEQELALTLPDKTNIEEVTKKTVENTELLVPPLVVDQSSVSKATEVEAQVFVEKTPEYSQNQMDKESIAQLFTQADQAVKQWNLMLPKGNNAYDKYKKILSLDPLNIQARKGILEIIGKYVSLANKSVQDNKFRLAKDYINNALVIREKYIANGYAKDEFYGVSQSVSISNIRSYKGQINKQEALYNLNLKQALTKNTPQIIKKTPDQFFNEGLAAYKAKEYSSAVSLLNKAAKQNDPQAQALLGTMYAQGDGVVQSYPEAINWLTKAANANNAKAQVALAKMYYKGLGVNKDYTRSFELHEKAAKQGDDIAQYSLGNMYFQGRGVKKDYDESFAWFKKAADQNNVDAIGLLGAMYEYGRGVRKNSNIAVSLYKKAARQGDDFSIKKLRKRGISRYD